MTLYLGYYSVCGHYLSTHTGPSSFYFQQGNPEMQPSRPTYFTTKAEARAAGEAEGHEVQEKPKEPHMPGGSDDQG